MADVDDVDELIATRKLHGLEDNLYKDIKTEDNIKRCEKLTEPQNANWLGISNQKAIAGVLARIKELEEILKEKDEEIKHWKNGFERELEDNRKNTCELLKQDLIIRQKDKQIDLMAEFISKQDVEEEICIKNKTNPDLCNEDYTNCKSCIKQYFERKSKEC